VPLEVGAVDEDYQHVFDEIVVPVLREFEPDLLLISAGFDAHERDPLAGMRLTTPSFGAMTMALRRVAEECCMGRIVAVTEGGYDLQAFAASLDAAIDALASPLAEPVWPSSGIDSARGSAAVDACRDSLAAFWHLR
jgi:acetoin utilization deacetylase AcuC-like enzyme